MKLNLHGRKLFAAVLAVTIILALSMCIYSGVHNHYRKILGTEYTRLKKIGREGKYIAVLRERDYYGGPIWVIYDLAEHKFVFSNDYDFCISEIEAVDDRQFKLIDMQGRHFATLRLPGYYDGGYCPEPVILPHFSDACTPVGTFVRAAQDVCLPPEDWFLEGWYEEDPYAYTLLSRLAGMSEKAHSPADDLNLAKAFEYCVGNDAYYEGDLDRAMDDMAALLDVWARKISILDSHVRARYERMLSSLRMTMCYSGMIDEYPVYMEEYIAWHDLMEAISCYNDYLRGTGEWYVGWDDDIKLEMAGWFSSRLCRLGEEKRILTGAGSYATSRDSLKTQDDMLRIFEKYYSPLAPDCYCPMWYEIRPAVESWSVARDKIAEGLPEDRAESYRAHTRDMTDWICGMIESKDSWFLVPALPR